MLVLTPRPWNISPSPQTPVALLLAVSPLPHTHLPLVIRAWTIDPFCLLRLPPSSWEVDKPSTGKLLYRLLRVGCRRAPSSHQACERGDHGWNLPPTVAQLAPPLVDEVPAVNLFVGALRQGRRGPRRASRGGSGSGTGAAQTETARAIYFMLHALRAHPFGVL